MTTVSTALLFVVFIPFASGAFAEGFPSKPVRVIIPSAPYSDVDVVGRAVSRNLAARWGRPVVVENYAGPGGTFGTALVARSPADGYTVLVTSGAHTVNPVLYKNLPYDTFKDFAEVVPLANLPQVLVVAPSIGIRTMADLIAAAKEKPGQLSFASPAAGSGVHLTGEKFKLSANIDVVHAPYKGGADVMAGRVTYWIPPIGAVFSFVRGGKLAALAVTTLERSAFLPEVPTIAEAGIAGFDDFVWFGMWVPAGTPEEIQNNLAKETSRAVSSRDLREQLSKLFAQPMSMTREQFSIFARQAGTAAVQIAGSGGIRPQYALPRN